MKVLVLLAAGPLIAYGILVLCCEYALGNICGHNVVGVSLILLTLITGVVLFGTALLAKWSRRNRD